MVTEPVKVEIDGREFTILGMPLMEAQKCDIKILGLLAPLAGAIDGLDLGGSGDDASEATGISASSTSAEEDDADSESALTSEEIMARDAESRSSDVAGLGVKNFAIVGAAIQRALSSLSDPDRNALIRSMLKRVTCIPPGASAVLLDSDAHIDAAFSGLGPTSLYKLLFHVARVNKFTPFAAAADGSVGGPVGEVLRKVTGAPAASAS